MTSSFLPTAFKCDQISLHWPPRAQKCSRRDSKKSCRGNKT